MVADFWCPSTPSIQLRVPRPLQVRRAEPLAARAGIAPQSTGPLGDRVSVPGSHMSATRTTTTTLSKRHSDTFHGKPDASKLFNFDLARMPSEALEAYGMRPAQFPVEPPPVIPSTAARHTDELAPRTSTTPRITSASAAIDRAMNAPPSAIESEPEGTEAASPAPSSHSRLLEPPFASSEAARCEGDDENHDQSERTSTTTSIEIDRSTDATPSALEFELEGARAASPAPPTQSRLLEPLSASSAAAWREGDDKLHVHGKRTSPSTSTAIDRAMNAPPSALATEPDGARAARPALSTPTCLPEPQSTSGSTARLASEDSAVPRDTAPSAAPAAISPTDLPAAPAASCAPMGAMDDPRLATEHNGSHIAAPALAASSSLCGPSTTTRVIPRDTEIEARSGGKYVPPELRNAGHAPMGVQSDVPHVADRTNDYVAGNDLVASSSLGGPSTAAAVFYSVG